MRLMRSESCTFIWQPKVLMQAVLPSGRACPAGFLESGMGVVGVVLLILFLRLVDAGSQGDLPRTTLEPQLLDLHVPGPRRPPEYIRNACTFLLPQLQNRPTIRSSTSPPSPHSPGFPPRRNILDRPHLTTQYPLHAPDRYAKAKPERHPPQTRTVCLSLYYAVK